MYIYWPTANYTRQPINHGSLTQCSFIFTDNDTWWSTVTHFPSFPFVSLPLKARPRPSIRKYLTPPLPFLFLPPEVAQREAKEANDKAGVGEERTVTEGYLSEGGARERQTAAPWWSCGRTSANCGVSEAENRLCKCASVKRG